MTRTMRSESTHWLLALVFVGAFAGDGLAGMRDDPPPDTGDGKESKVVYRMGALAFDPGHVDFVVTCTNLGPKASTVVLEVYDEDDRRTGNATKMRLEPQASGTFASSAVAARPGDVVVEDLPPIDHGRARVSAKRGDIACTAVSRLRGDDGETREVPFALVKRVAPRE